MKSRSKPLAKTYSLRQCLSVADIRAIEACGLAASAPLMSRAAQAAFEWVAALVPAPVRVIALAGPGNNGGDALVTACLLQIAGYQIDVVMPIQARGAQAQPLDDASRALKDWQHTDQPVLDRLPTSLVDTVMPDLVIDGLFGIGLSRALGEPFQSLIDTVNAWQVPVLALDLPSGLDADTGQPLGRPVKASATLAFIAPCPAFCAPVAQAFLGECHVATLED